MAYTGKCRAQVTGKVCTRLGREASTFGGCNLEAALLAEFGPKADGSAWGSLCEVGSSSQSILQVDI
jgi:hypothetical protein